MLRGSESIHRKAVAAATVAVMHATVRRVHTGVCAHTFPHCHSIEALPDFLKAFRTTGHVYDCFIKIYLF